VFPIVLCYRLLEQYPNEFRNTLVALGLRNFPQSRMLICAEAYANLFFPAAELHFGSQLYSKRAYMRKAFAFRLTNV
jgi:hypothetical protein